MGLNKYIVYASPTVGKTTALRKTPTIQISGETYTVIDTDNILPLAFNRKRKTLFSNIVELSEWQFWHVWPYVVNEAQEQVIDDVEIILKRMDTNIIVLTNLFIDCFPVIAKISRTREDLHAHLLKRDGSLAQWALDFQPPDDATLLAKGEYLDLIKHLKNADKVTEVV